MPPSSTFRVRIYICRRVNKEMIWRKRNWNEMRVRDVRNGMWWGMFGWPLGAMGVPWGECLDKDVREDKSKRGEQPYEINQLKASNMDVVWSSFNTSAFTHKTHYSEKVDKPRIYNVSKKLGSKFGGRWRKTKIARLSGMYDSFATPEFGVWVCFPYFIFEKSYSDLFCL